MNKERLRQLGVAKGEIDRLTKAKEKASKEQLERIKSQIIWWRSIVKKLSEDEK